MAVTRQDPHNLPYVKCTALVMSPLYTLTSTVFYTGVLGFDLALPLAWFRIRVLLPVQHFRARVPRQIHN